jgi:ectoine hydroxylase-related dioxygenase (phytanoyl-CoA dioxygenase family)
MPLEDATLDNGCMQYIPMSNRGPVLQHQSYTNDARVHAIECCDEFSRSSRVICPIPWGSAIIHDGRTLHHSGPNLTEVDRYAYILAFELPPRPVKERRDFYWNRGKRTRNQIRRSSWRLKGRIAIEAIRKHRVGILSSPGRALFELQRGIRALLKFLNRSG